MKWLMKAPSFDDLVNLLSAWRLILAGALAGCLAALLVYWIAPPPYRAQATLLVDHNIEQVVLQEEKDNNRFYYLAQENDKLIEVAWSDQVLGVVSMESSVPVNDLRGGMLSLSQPGDGGWHLLATSPDRQLAVTLASAWARALSDTVRQGGTEISPLTQVTLVEVSDLPVDRSVSAGSYLFFGSLAGTALVAFLALFFVRKVS